jgi:hypothetical protein
MEEPLPRGWRVVWSETYQAQYWFHADRRESSWLRPFVDPSGRETFAEHVDGNGPGTQEVPSPEPSPLSDGGGGFGGAQSPKYSPRVGGSSSARDRGFDGHGKSTVLDSTEIPGFRYIQTLGIGTLGQHRCFRACCVCSH